MRRTLLLVCYVVFGVHTYAQDNRVWATYFGGIEEDKGLGNATDVNGNVYITGYTQNDSGISFNGFQNIFAGGPYDAFLVKFDSIGNRIWSTYYGGAGFDIGTSIAIDDYGNIYLAGYTSSSSGIAAGGFQNAISSNGNGRDAFVVKFDSNGNRLWSTYYGGPDNDYGYDIAINHEGEIYLLGYTNSLSGISSGGFQDTFGGGAYDAFLAKFGSSGNRIWATYYGGQGDDEGNSIVADASGNIYVAGKTNSPSSIAADGFQNSFGGTLYDDAFLVKFNSAGDRIWATYYGGAADDEGLGVAIDTALNIYLAGTTETTSGIAADGFQNSFGGLRDAFLTKFDSLGNRLWATYYGGTDAEMRICVASDIIGNVYLSGDTYSSSGIAFEGYQNNLIQARNQFVANFDENGNRICSTYYGQTKDFGCDIAIDGNRNIYIVASTGGTAGIASGGFQDSIGGYYDAYLVKLTPCSNCMTGLVINISQIGDTLYATNAPNYQWYRNENIIPGATNQNYIVYGSGDYYVLTSTDSCTLTSNIIETGCLCVGIDENSFFQSISLFPNPAQDLLTISVQLNTVYPASIKLTDALGRIVFEKEEDQQATSFNWQIPVSAYATGIYFAEIVVAGQTQYRKIAVQH